MAIAHEDPEEDVVGRAANPVQRRHRQQQLETAIPQQDADVPAVGARRRLSGAVDLQRRDEGRQQRGRHHRGNQQIGRLAAPERQQRADTDRRDDVSE